MKPNVLLFKVNHLGDNVAFLAAAQMLAKEAVFDRITLWTTPIAEPLYRSITSRVDLKITPYRSFYDAWKNPFHLARLSFAVRRTKSKFSLVAEDMGNTAYFLSLVSGAESRWGIQPPYLKIPQAINRVVALDPDEPAPLKSWKLARSMAEAAGAARWPDTPPSPDLSHLQIVPTDTYDVVIHPGASRDYKRWDLSNFIEVARRLSRDLRVGWFRLDDRDPVPPAPTEVITVRSLEGLVSVLASSRLFLGNNSGPMNIATALGTPCVVVAGPSPKSWDPYWHSARALTLRDEKLPCIRCDPPGLPIREVCTNLEKPRSCMKSWSVERVEAEVRAWYLRWASLRP